MESGRGDRGRARARNRDGARPPGGAGRGGIAQSPEAREVRHGKLAERLKGTPILVHRGADRFAPENTLEAYAAAMDRGAGGVEIDIHRTMDGVLVLHHDDELGRTVEGAGLPSSLSALSRRESQSGRAWRGARGSTATTTSGP
ncbi:MAG: hypothetical protein HY721_23925 [Planctomycetes bacterium]|nr:hypothetical protein [Planctomycetota bacterium]